MSAAQSNGAERASMHHLEMMLARACLDTIETNLSVWYRFVGEPEWIELQTLDVRADRSNFETSKFAYTGDVQTAARLATIADKWDAPAVYLVANPILPGVASRAETGHWHTMKKGKSTVDAEIAHRSVLIIDIDARRVKGRRRRMRKWLTRFPPPWRSTVNSPEFSRVTTRSG